MVVPNRNTYPADAVVKAARAGDADALTELYSYYNLTLRIVASRIAIDCDSVDDSVQEAWVVAIRRISELRHERAVTRWLCRITITASYGVLRSRQRAIGRYSVISLSAVESASFEDEILTRLLLEKLPSGMRQVVTLLSDGYTHREIARMLGITEGTSKSQSWKARTKLRGICAHSG